VAELAAFPTLLVSVDGDDQPVGYIAVEVLDGLAHVEQLSVDPAFGRQGRAAALLAAVPSPCTLTTFRDVAFNAPYYERQGFVVFDAPGPQLVQRMADEATHGLDPALRVAMIRRHPITAG
jgi:hypothetical protein